MHGHGARPNLCHYADCERSAPGQGFPRRYNLFDHMRRVHGWQGDKEDVSADASGARKARAPKRKSSTTPAKVEKKPKISKAVQQQQQRERQRNALNKEWSTKKQSIVTLLAGLDNLGDLGESQNTQLLNDFQEFFALREKYHTGIKEELAD